MSQLIESRAEFQALAVERLAEAKALLENRKWDGAYYLAGYCVELALKACIIKMLLTRDAFPEKSFSQNCYTHAIERLFTLARLDEAWTAAMKVDPELSSNWLLVKDWSEEKRYHRINEDEAKNLYGAIADRDHGVLAWIQTQW